MSCADIQYAQIQTVLLAQQSWAHAGFAICSAQLTPITIGTTVAINRSSGHKYHEHNTMVVSTWQGCRLLAHLLGSIIRSHCSSECWHCTPLLLSATPTAASLNITTLPLLTYSTPRRSSLPPCVPWRLPHRPRHTLIPHRGGHDSVFAASTCACFASKVARCTLRRANHTATMWSQMPAAAAAAVL